MLIGPAMEIAIVGDPDTDETEALTDVIFRDRYLPNAVAALSRGRTLRPMRCRSLSVARKSTVRPRPTSASDSSVEHRRPTPTSWQSSSHRRNHSWRVVHVSRVGYGDADPRGTGRHGRPNPSARRAVLSRRVLRARVAMSALGVAVVRDHTAGHLGHHGETKRRGAPDSGGGLCPADRHQPVSDTGHVYHAP